VSQGFGAFKKTAKATALKVDDSKGEKVIRDPSPRIIKKE
jgi:hypothetical protein